MLDAYPPEGRDALARVGATRAGLLYQRLIERVEPDAEVHHGYPAEDGRALPAGAALADFDGLVWTGSSLTIHDAEDPRVARQVALAREAYDAGVPAFGSCWAAQVATVAAGGRCGPIPRGREFGISRRIAATEGGRSHPLLAGRPAAFDAFTSHADEVQTLPAGARALAANDWCAVQAVALERGGGTFWAVQYHPEFDLHEVARLALLRADELIAQGTFASRDLLGAWVEDLEALHRDPTRSDLARRHEIDSALLDPENGTLELRNWIRAQIRGA